MSGGSQNNIRDLLSRKRALEQTRDELIGDCERYKSNITVLNQTNKTLLDENSRLTAQNYRLESQLKQQRIEPKIIVRKPIEHTIRDFKIGRFSDFEKQCSKWITVNNMRWRIFAEIIEHTDEDGSCEYLSFELECSGDGTNSWSAKVSAELRIISQQQSNGYYCHRFSDRVFNNRTPKWGYWDFLDCVAVEDERNGYIVDDAIILEAVFTVNE